jgi:phosphatidylglycerophosphatase A
LRPNPILVLIGTSLYSGYIPFAPGTFASLLAIPLVYLLSNNNIAYTLTTIGVIFFGIISAHYLSKIWNKKDDQRITIDEFAGILITFIFLPRIDWLILITGFILFRFFDIFKPLFIRRTERVIGGIGVMLDDIVAGLYANICLRILLLIIK